MNKYQRARTSIVLPRSGVARNIFTPMDNIGLMLGTPRFEGESLSNFRNRLYSSQTKKGDASVKGLTNAINRDLNLGQENIVRVTANQSFKLDVNPVSIHISGVGQNVTIPLIKLDADGGWIFESFSGLNHELNLVSGISSSILLSGVDLTPACLLEEQSSYKYVFNEPIPNSQLFYLGILSNGAPIQGSIISGLISFNDTNTFKVQVSDNPINMGEWSLDTSRNIIRVATTSRIPLRASYTYNTLTSGRSIDLYGSGAKVLNLMHTDVQKLVVSLSGINYTGSDIITELINKAKIFWSE